MTAVAVGVALAAVAPCVLVVQQRPEPRADVQAPEALLAKLRAALPSIATIEAIPAAAAFLAGHAHAEYRRSGGACEAILPDFLIGAHAAVTGRPLLMRDPRRVGTYIPGARLIAPAR